MSNKSVDENDMKNITKELDYHIITALHCIGAQHNYYCSWIPKWFYDMYKDEANKIYNTIKQRTINYHKNLNKKAKKCF